MPIDFYYMGVSGPCRAVHMAAKEYGIEMNIKTINLREQDHMKPNFLKINPMHLIPTIDDDGFYLWESAAIMTYLANKYGPADDKLYPKDPQQRAAVDRVLHFATGLYGAYFSYYANQIMHQQKADPEMEKKLKNALHGVETYLKDHKYLAGDHRTLADLSVLSTVNSIENFDADLSEWPKMQNWLKMMKAELPYYDEVNKEALKDYKAWYLEGKS